MFARRLKRWLNSPLSYKFHSIHRRMNSATIGGAFLTPLFKLARMQNLKMVKSAAFDSLPHSQEFALKAAGSEQFIVIPTDLTISKSVFVNDEFSFHKIEKVISLLGPNFRLDTLIDVGANIGTVCIPVVKRGYAKKAIAVEPGPQNFRALAASIYLNDLADRITPYNLALGSERNQTLTFELSPTNSGDHRIRVSEEGGLNFENERETITVKTDTLDGLIPDIDKTNTLIWMDTQGYEGFILQGATKAIADRVPMTVEFWPYGMNRAQSYPLFKKALLGYSKFYDLAEDGLDPTEMSEAALDKLYNKFNEHLEHTDILVV